MHLSDIFPCTSSSAFDNDASELPSATTTMTSAGSETNVPSSTTNSSVRTSSKKWRARALSPIRVPKSLRLWSNSARAPAGQEDDIDIDLDIGDLNSELPSPVIRVSSRPTEVCSPTPTWNRGVGRTLPSIEGMVFTERGRALPSARTRSRPVSSIIPMSAAARATEVQAFATESTLLDSSTTSSRDGSFVEVRTIRDADIFGSPLTPDEHAFDSQTFHVRVDPNDLTTCDIIRPVGETQGHRRLRRCLSLPRDLSRTFQSFSCIHSDDVDSPNSNIGFEGPKSASPQVTSFKIERDEDEKVIAGATWASIFGLMEAPSKRRSAVFGKLVDDVKIEHGQLIMPQVEITVTRAVFVEEIEDDDETMTAEGSIEEIPRF